MILLGIDNESDEMDESRESWCRKKTKDNIRCRLFPKIATDGSQHNCSIGLHGLIILTL